MSNHIYKQVEITGSSEKGIQDAIETAVNGAAKSIRNMRWFELSELRGHIDNGAIKHWQATVKIGFDIEEK
jgi:hypothetical protein